MLPKLSDEIFTPEGTLLNFNLPIVAGKRLKWRYIDCFWNVIGIRHSHFFLYKDLIPDVQLTLSTYNEDYI